MANSELVKHTMTAKNGSKWPFSAWTSQMGPLLYEGEVTPVSAVVRRLKQGDAVEVNWR